MLDNIKATFFFKVIFSCLEKRRKLDIVKYNKNLQNKLDLNIKHYQVFSGRYILYESKGIGKEYNAYTNELLYEGEYSNGKRNGKGKVDYNGELIYEGEYKNGKQNGKGKRYINNKLSFEGEFLDDGIKNGILYDKDGKIDGEIKENGERVIFNEFGDIIFEGEYLNGQRNGKGKEYNSNGILIFEGEYLNGKRNGKGKEYYDNGDLKYEGEYLDGKRVIENLK